MLTLANRLSKRVPPFIFTAPWHYASVRASHSGCDVGGKWSPCDDCEWLGHEYNKSFSYFKSQIAHFPKHFYHTEAVSRRLSSILFLTHYFSVLSDVRLTQQYLFGNHKKLFIRWFRFYRQGLNYKTFGDNTVLSFQ